VGGWFDLLQEVGIHQSGGVSDEHFMEEALRQARKAVAKGEVPVGAVLVVEGKIVTRAHNQVEELKDATAHAEMLAVTAAAGELDGWRLTEATVYVTKEPCPMCAGALVLSRVKRVVYGAADPRMGAAGGAMNLLQFAGMNHQCEVTGGVRAEECRDLLKEFFQAKRLENGTHGDWSKKGLAVGAWGDGGGGGTGRTLRLGQAWRGSVATEGWESGCEGFIDLQLFFKGRGVSFAAGQGWGEGVVVASIGCGDVGGDFGGGWGADGSGGAVLFRSAPN